LSRSVKRSVALSSLWICSSKRLMAKSSLGLRGPGGLTVSLILVVRGTSLSLPPHCFANLSDNFDSSYEERGFKHFIALLIC
jgi:hypothetical protein